MTSHSFKFFRAGGFDQVRLDSGADLKALAELDPKLWVALASPTKGLEFDAHTLDLLDSEKDGRVRQPEVITAVKWTVGLLKNPDDLLKSAAELPLSAIDDSTDEGRQIIASAKEILKNLGKAGATAIAPTDTVDTAKIFGKTLFNGDGVIPAESAENDADTTQAIKEVMATVGSDKDMGGLDGITQARLDDFFKEAHAYVDWWKKALGDTNVLPLGEATAAAWAARDAVKAKVDDYFARCGVAVMDPRATAALNPLDAAYAALGGTALSADTQALSALPAARVEAGRALPLGVGVNPAWAQPLHTFARACVVPLLGERTELTFADWQALSTKLSAHEAWRATKPKTRVETLGITRLRALVEGEAKALIEALLARDKALEPQAKAIASVDRLAHYHRDLVRFLNNYVAFKDFYTRSQKAVFQAGTLYLDARSAELVLKVDDVAKHAALAAQSQACLVYCECVRKGGTEKQAIVAAFTDGDSEFLHVGRNGLYFDRQGRDWDATVVKVVDQPISLRQAFWTPYRRAGKFVSDQIEKFAASEDKAAADSLHGGITETAGTAKAKEPEKVAAPFDVARFAGIFAAIGLALGSIGAALAAVMTAFLGLKAWQMPLAVAGAMMVISGPSVLLAAMKLRQRNLGPLLDASGWAINTRALINIPFGSSLTHVAKLPPGAQRALRDPYAQAKQPWGLYLALGVLVAVAAWLFDKGFLTKWWSAPAG